MAKTYELVGRVYVTLEAPDAETATRWAEQYLEITGPIGVTRGIEIDYFEVDSVSDGDDDDG